MGELRCRIRDSVISKSTTAVRSLQADEYFSLHMMEYYTVGVKRKKNIPLTPEKRSIGTHTFVNLFWRSAVISGDICGVQSHSPSK